MKIGFLLPHAGKIAGGEMLRRIGTEAESAGLDSLWVGDHIGLPTTQETPYPYSMKSSYPVPSDRAFLDGLTTLAYVAGLVPRVQLGISVCIAPYRPPLLLAKIIGTLVTLTNERFILGVGSGWLEEEFRALSLDFHAREDFTDELANFLSAWCGAGENAVEFSGQFIQATGIHVHPTPPSSSLPLWVGGGGRRAQQRAANCGDAWHPPLWHNDPQRLERSFARIQEERYKAGTAKSALELTLWAPLRIARVAPTESPWESGILEGPSGYICDVLSKYASIGVTHVVTVVGGPPAERLRTIEVLAQEVRPYVS